MFVCTVGHWDPEQVFTEQWTVQIRYKKRTEDPSEIRNLIKWSHETSFFCVSKLGFPVESLMWHKDEGRPIIILPFCRDSTVSLCTPDAYFLKNLRITNVSVWNCPMGSEAVAGSEGWAQRPTRCVLSGLIPFGKLAVRRGLLKMGEKANSKTNDCVLSFEWKIFLLKKQKIQCTCIAWWFRCDVTLKD